MLRLRKMNYDDAVEQWNFVTALPADENGFTNPYEGISYDEYRDKVLPELMMHEHPINMPDWFVPATYYYLWDDDTLVGEFRIRHHLTDALRSGAGHIGYSILRVLKTNVPSFRVIMNNGAYLAGEDNDHYLMRVKK